MRVREHLWYAVFRVFRRYAVRKGSVRSTRKSCNTVSRQQTLVFIKKHNIHDIKSRFARALFWHLFFILKYIHGLNGQKIIKTTKQTQQNLSVQEWVYLSMLQTIFLSSSCKWRRQKRFSFQTIRSTHGKKGQLIFSSSIQHDYEHELQLNTIIYLWFPSALIYI